MRARFLAGRRSGNLFRYVVSLAVVIWLAGRLNGVDLGNLRFIDWPVATLGVVLAGAACVLQAIRWELLLQALGIQVAKRRVHVVFWIGQFFNSFLPGGVAGDALRFRYLWGEAPGQRTAAVTSLFFDRLLGLGSLCSLAAMALAPHFSARTGVELQSLFQLCLAACALIGAVTWALLRTRWWHPLAARLLPSEISEALRSSVHALARQPRLLALASLLSIAVWLIDFVSIWLLACSVGLNVSILTMSVAASAAYIAASLPISIGGHGIREGALLATLALLNVGTDEEDRSTLLAFLVLAVSLGWSLVGGLVYVLSPRTSGFKPTEAGVCR